MDFLYDSELHGIGENEEEVLDKLETFSHHAVVEAIAIHDYKVFYHIIATFRVAAASKDAAYAAAIANLDSLERNWELKGLREVVPSLRVNRVY